MIETNYFLYPREECSDLKRPRFRFWELKNLLKMENNNHLINFSFFSFSKSTFLVKNSWDNFGTSTSIFKLKGSAENLRFPICIIANQKKSILLINDCKSVVLISYLLWAESRYALLFYQKGFLAIFLPWILFFWLLF